MIVLKKIDSVIAGVSRGFAVVGSASIGLLALLVVADIIGREIGTPVLGVVEIAATTVVISAFLTIPYVLRRGGHIRATVLVSRLPRNVRKSLEAFGYVAGVVVFALLAYASFGEFVSAWENGSFEGEGSLRVPTWPARLTIFLSSLLMIFEGLFAAARTLMGEVDDD